MKRLSTYTTLLFVVLILCFIAACYSPIEPCRSDTGIMYNNQGDSVSYFTMQTCVKPGGIVLP